MHDPEPTANDVDEAPSEFEEHTLDLVRALRDAQQRGATEEAERIREELEEHGRELDEVRGVDQPSEEEAMEEFLNR